MNPGWWLLIGLVAGFLVGFRAGLWWFPMLLGRIETWALRTRIGQYRRRGRR
jgi:hypothetical protein